MWTHCSKTCGSGIKTRYRTCTNPVPTSNGRNCTGAYSETVACTIAGCPVDGSWSNWSPWLDCSVTCSVGYQTRSRECTDPMPENGGLLCEGSPRENSICKLEPCPIDGGLTIWSAWSVCSESCGIGTRIRSRSCTNPTPLYNGRNCIGAYTESNECMIKLCPVDGGWNLWSAWTSCTSSCDLGYKIRSRDCTNPIPKNGGRLCEGFSKENVTCNAEPCPVDGGFATWSDWSACSETCGIGSMTRSRLCTKPIPQHNGRNCTGAYSEAEECTVKLCPLDGGWGSWSTWTSCSGSCGGGQRERERACDNPLPRFGGQPCFGTHLEQIECNTLPCPIDGGFSQWSDWSSCSVTCGMGEKNRSRYCNNPFPKYNGKNCSGINSEAELCLTSLCPIDGEWNAWSPWSACNVSCGGGKRDRGRLCNNPLPRNNGRQCSGKNIESDNCKMNPCPIHGGFDQWGSWSFCSQTCGGGQRTRNRTCSNPNPAFGGSNCIGLWNESQDCNHQNCPGKTPYVLITCS